ncbi:hypothetical protein P12x_000660 [Tundrisphaera lichenicola]|uniref:hypothetical protein n=1 Tax=Tundrisphaera lichenicola TaxID=2029860 RepID=UPI003EBCCCD7
MIFRVYDEDLMYVIEAPEGSKVLARDEDADELALFEILPGGSTVERRLPGSVILKAARRGFLGLKIREVREPWPHPEVEGECTSEGSSDCERPDRSPAPRKA